MNLCKTCNKSPAKVEQRCRRCHRGYLEYKKRLRDFETAHERDVFIQRRRKVYSAKYMSLPGFKEEQRQRALWNKYKLTKEQYDEQLQAQNHACAICKSQETTKVFCVDHCHKTGKIRGLLCSQCNAGIGQLKDDPELIVAAASYVALGGVR